MKKSWRRFTVNLTCIACLLSLFAYMTIRWDYTVYPQSQLVSVTCTFDSFWLHPTHRGRGPAYIVDTNQHYYFVFSDIYDKIDGNLQPGDPLEMLVTPRRSIGNPEVAYLNVNGHVYCTYEEYHSIAASGRITYLVFSALALSVSAFLVIRMIVLTVTAKRKRKKREKRTQENMQRLREAGELHPKKQKSKHKNTPPT